MAVPMSMAEWTQAVIRSQTELVLSPHGDPMPKFPRPEMQVTTTGRSGELAITQAAAFYEDAMTAIEGSGASITADWHVLDFGSGWGRISRMAMRDVPLDHIRGIDVDADFVGISNSLFGSSTTFATCEPFPPSKLGDDSVDLVLSYSVFSHLSEAAATAWIREFSRVLRPGGFLVFTSRDQSFLDYALSLANRMNEVADDYHQMKLARMFTPEEHVQVREAFAAGEFIYQGNGGGGIRDGSFYGEAFIPRAWVERTHGEEFDVLRADIDGSRYDQTCFVLRRKAKAIMPAAAETAPGVMRWIGSFLGFTSGTRKTS
jgi:SAM-dependent methyltransferase